MTEAVFLRPGSVNEAIAALAADPAARPIAGGTDLMVRRATGAVVTSVLVQLHGLPGLDGIEVGRDGELRIRAMTRLRTIELSAVVRRLQPALADAVTSVATVRIRNQATLGGNITVGDPAHDPPPVLLALDAVVRVEGRGGSRAIPALDWFLGGRGGALGVGELVTRIDLPPRPPRSGTAYQSFVARTHDDYATASAAACIVLGEDGTVDSVRLAVGGLGPMTVRLPVVEDAVRGSRATDEIVRAAAALVPGLVEPASDARGSAAYRRAIGRAQVEDALMAAVAAARAAAA